MLFQFNLRKWMQMKTRTGIEQTEEEKKETEKAFLDIEESIQNIDTEEEKKNPYAKYKKLKQQELF